MLRTQVYLEEEQMREIDLLVALTKKGKAKVIRRVVTAGLNAVKKVQNDDEDSVGVQLGDLVNLGLSGPADASETMDDYLYGKKSRYAEHYSN